MDRFRSREVRDVFADVARFTARALEFSPPEMMRLAHNKVMLSTEEPLPLARAVSGIVRESFDSEEVDVDSGELFFSAALEDIRNIIEVIAAKYPDLGDKTLREAMTHPETIDTIALLALRAGGTMVWYIGNELKETSSLTSYNSYVINDTHLGIGRYGCPAAGYVATELQEGAVMPLPIFKKLIPWATDVHFLSDEWREFRAKTTVTFEN